MSAELVICDVLLQAEFTGLASKIARSAGFEPLVANRANDAQDAIGPYTVGLVSTVGWRNGFRPEERQGIMLLSMADVLDIPKAVVDDNNVDDTVRRYLRETDIILPRDDMGTLEERLGRWVYRLAGKN